MSFCPSQSWDNYCRSQEESETCICGQENWSFEENSWVCPNHPGFCSEECYQKYTEDQKRSNDAEAAYLAEIDKYFP